MEFIELTLKTGKPVLMNLNHIVGIHPVGNDSFVDLVDTGYEVQETYEQIKEKLGAAGAKKY